MESAIALVGNLPTWVQLVVGFALASTGSSALTALVPTVVRQLPTWVHSNLTLKIVNVLLRGLTWVSLNIGKNKNLDDKE